MITKENKKCKFYKTNSYWNVIITYKNAIIYILAE